MSGLSSDLAGGPGPLELLVLQPTPFCNINCSYCYLPDRQSTRRMSPDVLDAVCRRVFESGLVRHPFTVIWHAGEPLVLPVDYYRRAFGQVAAHNTTGVPLYHSIQTNGTLIDREWCDFFRDHPLILGVSVDGPAFLHDRHRRTRQGRGTLDAVLRGVRLLREHAVPFHAITVLTAESLDYPDELFDFYRENGVEEVGFNVEEIEGPHTQSSLTGRDVPARFARFLSRFLDLAVAADPPLGVRELEFALGALRRGRADPGRTQETRPLAIISVDCEGNFTTFSPELLGLPSRHYGDFTLGNVATDSFASALGSPKFRAMDRDVRAGLDRCRESCALFGQCGGGAPANKYFENGSFDSAETMFCRLNRKVLLDVVLTRLERGSLRLPAATPGGPGA